MRYFDKDGNQLTNGIRTIDNAAFAKEFPGMKGLKNDGYSKLIGLINGAYVPVVRRVNYVEAHPSLHKCDDRCLNGKCGGRCECQCGGANHGRGNT